ncbi:PREDICTED: gamma-secretase subunit APH-1A-like, partial [Calidris pugnax]|uniref:gamma-secretase subunit APH-1A-like n=1 Tax=Calidris pugnax TaxID=198806 RepID=UPI00071C2558
AFFWLVSLLLASLVWFVSVQLSDREDARLQRGLLLFGASVSVLLQETFRFAYFKLLNPPPAAFLTMALVLLHTFWGVIFFDACERRRFWCLGLVVATHLLTSGLVSALKNL